MASLSVLRLPRPRRFTGRSCGEALRLRETVRELDSKPLSKQILSDVLFAACGTNRRSGPFAGHGLTAASASNSQEVSVYVALQEGAYRFDSERHALELVVSEDVRRLAFTPGQPLISPDAPVQLVFVADLDRLEHTRGFEEPRLHDPEVQKSYYFVDTGMIAANVYLFAASQGLACWFHNCDRAGLHEKLQLGEAQRVLFAQTVGYRVAKGHAARRVSGA